MMKQPLALHISAIIIGLAVATGLFFWLKEAEFRTPPKLLVIGYMTSIEGRLDHRLPNTVRTKIVSGPAPLHHQELLITQRASSAELSFPTADALVRLHESTRFIAERDPHREDAIIATILDGAVTVQKVGKKDLIKFYKAGRELKLEGDGTMTLGVESAPALSAKSQPLPENEDEFRVIVTATTKPADSSKPEGAAMDSRTEPNSDILTNEDIIRQLRAQSGFFQRCYLNHIHREQAKAGESIVGTPASSGTIVTSFTIQTTGKVTDAKVIRSDFKDSILHSCVAEVLERTTFRGFKGEPVPVREFPISFQ